MGSWGHCVPPGLGGAQQGCHTALLGGGGRDLGGSQALHHLSGRVPSPGGHSFLLRGQREGFSWPGSPSLLGDKPPALPAPPAAPSPIPPTAAPPAPAPQQGPRGPRGSQGVPVASSPPPKKSAGLSGSAGKGMGTQPECSRESRRRGSCPPHAVGQTGQGLGAGGVRDVGDLGLWGIWGCRDSPQAPGWAGDAHRSAGSSPA